MPTVILDLYFPLSAYGPLSGRGLWTRLTDGFMFSSFAPLRRTDGWETKKTRCNRLLTKRESVWKQRNLGIEGDVVSCLYEFFSLAPQAPAALLPREEERQLVATSLSSRFLNDFFVNETTSHRTDERNGLAILSFRIRVLGSMSSHTWRQALWTRRQRPRHTAQTTLAASGRLEAFG